MKEEEKVIEDRIYKKVELWAALTEKLYPSSLNFDTSRYAKNLFERRLKRAERIINKKPLYHSNNIPIFDNEKKLDEDIKKLKLKYKDNKKSNKSL